MIHIKAIAILIFLIFLFENTGYSFTDTSDNKSTLRPPMLFSKEKNVPKPVVSITAGGIAFYGLRAQVVDKIFQAIIVSHDPYSQFGAQADLSVLSALFCMSEVVSFRRQLFDAEKNGKVTREKIRQISKLLKALADSLEPIDQSSLTEQTMLEFLSLAWHETGGILTVADLIQRLLDGSRLTVEDDKQLKLKIRSKLLDVEYLNKIPSAAWLRPIYDEYQQKRQILIQAAERVVNWDISLSSEVEIRRQWIEAYQEMLALEIWLVRRCIQVGEQAGVPLQTMMEYSVFNPVIEPSKNWDAPKRELNLQHLLTQADSVIAVADSFLQKHAPFVMDVSTANPVYFLSAGGQTFSGTRLQVRDAILNAIMTSDNPEEQFGNFESMNTLSGLLISAECTSLIDNIQRSGYQRSERAKKIISLLSKLEYIYLVNRSALLSGGNHILRGLSVMYSGDGGIEVITELVQRLASNQELTALDIRQLGAEDSSNFLSQPFLMPPIPYWASNIYQEFWPMRDQLRTTFKSVWMRDYYESSDRKQYLRAYRQMLKLEVWLAEQLIEAGRNAGIPEQTMLEFVPYVFVIENSEPRQVFGRYLNIQELLERAQSVLADSAGVANSDVLKARQSL